MSTNWQSCQIKSNKSNFSNLAPCVRDIGAEHGWQKHTFLLVLWKAGKPDQNVSKKKTFFSVKALKSRLCRLIGISCWQYASQWFTAVGQITTNHIHAGAQRGHYNLTLNLILTVTLQLPPLPRPPPYVVFYVGDISVWLKYSLVKIKVS